MASGAFSTRIAISSLFDYMEYGPGNFPSRKSDSVGCEERVNGERNKGPTGGETDCVIA